MESGSYKMPMTQPDDLHPLQVAAWKRMSHEEKWQLAKSAQQMVIEAARRRISRQNPDCDALTVQKELSRFLIRARS
jgi:hypothetical protein